MVSVSRNRARNITLSLMIVISAMTVTLTLLVWQTHRSQWSQPFEVLAENPFVPYLTGHITLERPGVVFTATPKGLIQRKSLARRLKMPNPHEPAIIGDHVQERYFPFRNGRFTGGHPEPVMLVIENVLVNSESVFIQDNNYVMLSRACHPRYWEAFYRAPEQVTHNYTCYEHVISVGHQHSSDFGHWFLEVLPAIAAMPDDIRKRSMIILPRNGPHIVDGLRLLGINQSQLVVGETATVFAKRLYTVEMPMCGDLSRDLVLNFRKILAAKFGLGKKKPTKFVMYNRENMSRAIGNYKELKAAVREKWPHIEWEEAVVKGTMREQALYFDQVKFLFCVHGSIEANLIFMQEDTAVVDLQMEQWLLSFLYLSAFTGKYVTVGQDVAISWRSLTPNIVDIEYVLTLIESGLRQVKAI